MRLLLLLLMGLLASACGADVQPAVPDAAPGIAVPAGAQEATVVRLVDGDTVLLRGRGVGPLPAEPTRVRLLLIDAPEVHTERECFGLEAAERAAELLPEGTAVRVQADRDPRDRFDRPLLHVWDAEGRNVGEALVREGLAQVLFLRPNDRYLERFEAAEEEASRAGRGLWSAC